MELRHLRYFLTVAELGSLNRAAAHLRVAQPSLSRQVRALERELGRPLLERSARGVSLTPAGAALAGHARQLLALEAATADVVAGSDRTRETVSVGVPPGIPPEWLVGVVRQLGERLPECALNLVEASTSDQLRALQAGELDIGMIHQSPPSGYLGKLLWTESFGVALRPGHPLASAATHRLADLDGLRVLIHSRGQVPDQQDSLLAAANTAGVHPIWIFARFVEHALAAAEAQRVDAVCVGSSTARRQLPEWRWAPLLDLPLSLTTWAVHRGDTRRAVVDVAEAIAKCPAPVEGNR
ncbi:LysR family transcriptional regulator [Pseudonocardia thermophila]|jgi:Transcriptional regulator|uniref:LysR family transcriptional regulator n=1 Tax=Pseudonocardia thermophila TaxID=1848 RepID=UPI00248DC118|nr:LysR family transcriptional regulator [Pseudonocardia thermophila]